LMLLPVLQSQFKALGGLEFLIIGIAAISLGRDPNGIANHLFTLGRWTREQIPVLNRSIAGDTPHETVPLEAERLARHGVA
jgi:branched-chain amino acid transport system permease protein